MFGSPSFLVYIYDILKFQEKVVYMYTRVLVIFSVYFGRLTLFFFCYRCKFLYVVDLFEKVFGKRTKLD